jgi:single-strand DNA-binding protein
VQWLLHRRMNAQQQMRWTPRGAHLMLKVRCAVVNGTLERRPSPRRRAGLSPLQARRMTPRFETLSEWHRVVIFNEGLGRIADPYLAKGTKVYVEGMLRTRKWQTADGHDRYSTEIHLTPYNGTLTFLDP